MKWIKGIGVVLGVIIALNTVIGLSTDKETPLGSVWAMAFGPVENPFGGLVFSENPARTE